MSAHPALDLGDLVRSVSLSRQGFSLADYTALLRGFCDPEVGVELAPEACVDAPMYVTLMLAVRFLTDHLQGDVYFRVQERGANLQRAQAQFEILRQMAEARTQMLAAARTHRSI